MIDRRQTSLQNYNDIFQDHKIEGEGCYYNWIEKDDAGIYIAYVDSSLLGDHKDTTHKVPGVRWFEDIAKGKISKKQSECLLEWHDCGLLGNLTIPNSDGEYIKKDVYAKSLKILVMHHYLFEPFNHKSEYLLRLKNRENVFRNIAMSDFDMLLCGHKHFHSSNKHRYGEHFDKRATIRYVMNCFRRNMGIESLPLQYTDKNGNRFSKAISDVVNVIIGGIKATQHTDSESYIDELIEILKEGIDNPQSFQDQFRYFCEINSSSGAEEISKTEIKEIGKKISIFFDREDRTKLSFQSNRLMNIAKKVKNRPFLKNMSGSSAKSSLKEQERTLCLYELVPDTDQWKIKCLKYSWDWQSNKFNEVPDENNEVLYRNATRQEE